MPRTDLAVETARRLSLAGGLESAGLEGVKRRIDIIESSQAELTDITITNTEAAELIGRPKGRYITLKALDSDFAEFSPCFENRVQLLARQLRRLTKGAEKIMVAGLGNRSITADAVGPLCVDRIFATRHIKQYAREIESDGLTELSVIETGVLGQTGIEASEQIKAVCEAVKPDTVIAVDSLACFELGHLGRTIQLCDSGISPGSGVENNRRELSRSTLGVTCIAIGVPMVVDLSSAAEMIFGSPAPENSAGMTVTPHSVDKLARNAAEYIAMAINLAFQRTLTLNDLRSLI